MEETAAGSSSNVVTNPPSPEEPKVTIPADAPEVLSAALGSVVKFYSGINLGVCQSVITASDAENTQVVELESNDLSGRTTPSVLAFHKNTRLVGDTAENVMAKEPLSTIALLPMLIRASTKADFEMLKKRFGPLLSFLEAVQDDGTIDITFGGVQWKLEASQILAAYLRRLATFVVDGRNTKNAADAAAQVTLSSGQYCISLPDHSFHPGVKKPCLERIARACRTGAFRWELAKITSQTTAVVAGWMVRNLASVLDLVESQSFHVGFLNIGFSEASIQIVKFTRCDPNVMKDEGSEPSKEQTTFRYNDTLVTFGPSESIDIGAFDFAKDIASLYVKQLRERKISIEWEKAFSPADATKLNRAQRKAVNAVLNSSIKLMKDLSGLPQAHSTYSDEEVDVQIEISREQFENESRAKLSAVLEMVESALKRCIDTAGTSNIDFLGMELVGGGCRIPCVQKGVETLLQNSIASKNVKLLGESVIRRTLDGTAAASFGATYIASGVAPKDLPNVYAARDVENVWTDDSQRELYMQTERSMRQIECDELKRREASNKLEATIMKFENLSRSKEIANASELARITEKYSDWYYENMDNSLTADDYDKKEKELIEETHELCREYYEREQKKKEQMEKELDQKAKENEGREKEDHDFRKLPNSQRLEKAERNKNEGNDMFKAGNWLKAAERYQQALAHLDKMFDESPADAEKKKQLKISLNLNLAMVYAKQDGDEALNKVIQRCNMALSYDENNSKVLYRRGLAYEAQGKYEEALQDLQKCAKSQVAATGSVEHVTSRSIQRIKDRIVIQNKKAKQMYAKMF